MTPLFARSVGQVPPLRGEVHLWPIALDDAPSLECAGVLSADELERAARFRRARDAQGFVSRRIALRRVISGYIGVAPGRLRFAQGASGKRYVVFPEPARGLAFSTSHTDGLALIAICRHQPVGVDIERVTPLEEWAQIAAQCFSRGERAALAALPEPERTCAFFRRWTCKEALVKALGGGLALGLDRFEVGLAPGKSRHTVRFDGSETGAGAWFLSTLEPAPGYIAAVALASARVRLVWRDYNVFNREHLAVA